ncbi:MAG: regulatory protein RecX [Cyclobacteriaceae bacterium]
MRSGEKPKKRLTPAEARTRIQRYCAYQERSHRQVRSRLFDYGLHSDDVESAISELITEGYLNEERFAKAFAGGKFRMKKWGKNKIEHQLKSQGLNKRCIATGLKEIDQEEYTKSMTVLLKKKLSAIKEANPLIKKHKAGRFMIGKGYEPELVWQQLERILPD